MRLTRSGSNGCPVIVMTNETTTSGLSIRNTWRQLTVALLSGVFTMSVLVYLVTLLQAPDVSPPVRMAPIFAFVATFASIAGPLVWWENTVGYASAALAGAIAILGIALYASGVFGPASAGPGPLLYAFFGALLVVVSVVASRRRTAVEPTGGSTPPSR